MIRRRAPIARHSSRKGTKTSKHRRSRKGQRRECDRIFALAVKDRDGWACRRCGSHVNPQCAHLVSRRYAATRWDFGVPGNAVCLCQRCHMKFTHDPLGWEAWIEEKWPGHLAQLKARARMVTKVINYEAIAESLTGGRLVF